MKRELAALALVVAAWLPALALLYRLEVSEEKATAARWAALFSTPESQRYRLFFREANGQETYLGTLTQSLTIEADRACLYTGLGGTEEVAVQLNTVVSKQAGFLSTEGVVRLFGREFSISADRSCDIVALEVRHHGGSIKHRLPVSMLSPESAAGFSSAMPFRDIKNFHAGMRWKGLILETATLKVRPAEMLVSRVPVELDYQGRRLRVLEASVVGVSGYRAWYLADGRVLRQVMPAGSGTLLIERCLDKEHE